MQADRDVFIVGGTMGTLLDPSATDAAVTAKMGIDATKPLGSFASTLTINQKAVERARELLQGRADLPKPGR